MNADVKIRMSQTNDHTIDGVFAHLLPNKFGQLTVNGTHLETNIKVTNKRNNIQESLKNMDGVSMHM